MDLIKFSQIISSRLCHDFISPAGAMSSGLELIDETDVRPPEIIDLIKRSSFNLNHRLVYYRAAWGEGSLAHAPSVSNLCDLVQNFCTTYAVTFNPAVNLDAIFFKSDLKKNNQFVKVILNAVVFIKDVLPQGGTLSLIVRDDSDWPELEFIFEGRIFHIKEDLALILREDFDESLLSPRTVHALLLRLYVEDLGLSIRLNEKEEKLILSIIHPESIK